MARKAKFFTLAVLFLFTATLFNGTALTYAKAFSVEIDGRELVSGASLLNEQGRIMVPVRDLGEALGLKVRWYADERMVTLQKGDLLLRLTVGSRVAEKNDEKGLMEVAPKVVNGRCFVPLRFVAQTFGCQVGWDQGKRLAEVKTGMVEEISLGTLSPLEPMNILNDLGAWYRMNHLGFTHVQLVQYDAQLNIVPCLAEKWEVSPDGKAVTFYLVKDALWHDGKPVTAEDVKFTFEYKLAHLKELARWTVAAIEKIEVADAHTVTFYLKEPLVFSLFKDLAIGIGIILPKHIWENIDDPKKYTARENLIGCGPFIFESYDPASQTASFKADHDYLAGQPGVEKVRVKYYKNVDALVMALKKGEIAATYDYAMPVPASYAPALQDTPGLELGGIPDLGIMIYMSFGREYPVQEKLFREAVSYAIDYEMLVKAIAGDHGEVPGRGIVPPSLPGYDPTIPRLKQDLAKANALLDKMGLKDKNGDGIRELPDGSKLSIPVTPATKKGKETMMVRAAEIICSQLKKVGIDAHIDQEVIGNEDKWQQRVWNDRDYWIYLGYATPGAVIYDGGLMYFVDAKGAFGTCTDPEYVRIYEKIRYAKDASEWTGSLKEAQQYHARELPGMALIWGKALYPYRTDSFTGWVMRNGFGPVNYQTWFTLRAH
ncbi:MAG: ABC transporter substrate-binding protein [Bacillota bacterium]|nr:ABC transporter substrate-binding protein [Bacillota bacterium]